LHFDTHVTWHENRKFLKVEFPLNVRNEMATYSIQYGSLQRPTHSNTSWDMAKFEVCGHHWADLSEYGFGVSLLSTSKYGFACQENVLRLSLLRSPKKPDETADMGNHSFSYALYPHSGDHAQANLPRQGYHINQPLIPYSTSLETHFEPYTLFSLDRENLMLEVVKQAEGSLVKEQENTEEHTYVLRIWETLGGRGTGTLISHLPIKSIKWTNLLEEETGNVKLTWENGQVHFPFKPFQIITLKISLK